MSRRSQFDRAVAALNAAAFDDARWPEASRWVEAACGAKGNVIVIGDEGAAGEVEISLARICFGGRRSAYWERRYFERLWRWDERIPRLRQLPDGRLVGVPSLYTADERKRSRAYRELARAESENGLNMRLTLPDGGKVTWQLANPAARDGWSSGELRAARALGPHLLHYARVRRALAQADALGQSMQAVLEAKGVGAVQLDRRGRILAASDAALAHLRDGRLLGEENGALKAASDADDNVLQGLLAGALGASAAGGSLLMRRTGVPAPLMLHVIPIAAPVADAGFGPIAALALLVDPGGPAPDRGLLVEGLGLTPAEAEVAALLAEGLTTKQAGLASGRSHGTTRWHLNNIFVKLGIKRQSDLARLVHAQGWRPAGSRNG